MTDIACVVLGFFGGWTVASYYYGVVRRYHALIPRRRGTKGVHG